MLVLKRRREQSINIGPDLTITVASIESGIVTLSVSRVRNEAISISPEVYVKVLRVGLEDDWVELGVIAPELLIVTPEAANRQRPRSVNSENLPAAVDDVG